MNCLGRLSRELGPNSCAGAAAHDYRKNLQVLVPVAMALSVPTPRRRAAPTNSFSEPPAACATVPNPASTEQSLSLRLIIFGRNAKTFKFCFAAFRHAERSIGRPAPEQSKYFFVSKGIADRRRIDDGPARMAFAVPHAEWPAAPAGGCGLPRSAGRSHLFDQALSDVEGVAVSALEHRAQKCMRFWLKRCSIFLNLEHLIRPQVIPLEGGML